MKIVLQHDFEKANAEKELAFRMVSALERIGHQAYMSTTSSEIELLKPDLVLAMHMDFPKSTQWSTFGCMWNPPVFFADNDQLTKNIATYDGYLSASPRIGRFVDHFCAGLNRQVPKGTLYPSACQAEFSVLDFSTARLVYLGSGWDGARHSDLIKFLSSFRLFDVYGPSEAWLHAPTLHRGEIPFDGVSLGSVLKRSGISLCLHRAEHLAWEVPNMRVFEGAAASNVLISDDHSFVRQAFGDAVFYLDKDLPPDGHADQIRQIVSDVQAHPKRAQEMAKACNETFNKQLALEVLLEPVLGLVDTQHRPTSRRSRPNLTKKVKPSDASGIDRALSEASPSIDCIVRTGFRDARYLARTFEAIVSQTVPISRVILVNHQSNPDVKTVVEEFQKRLNIRVIDIPEPVNRSHSLWSGLAEVEADYFCILDDDDTWLPWHIETLLEALSEKKHAVLAYSGSQRVVEGTIGIDGCTNVEARNIAYLEPFDGKRLLEGPNYIPSNAFLARSEALNESVRASPNLEVLEDYWLLIQLLRQGAFVSVIEVTSRLHWRASQDDNVMFQSNQFEQAGQDIRTRLMFDDLPHTFGAMIKPIIREDSLQAWKNKTRIANRSIKFTTQVPKVQRRSGCIDSVSVNGETCTIEGWAPYSASTDTTALHVVGVGDFKEFLSPIVFRPDVCRHLNDWSFFRAGFKFEVAVQPGFVPTGVRIFVKTADEIIELNPNRKKKFWQK